MADDGIRVCCDHHLPAIFLYFYDRRGEAVRAHDPLALPRSGGIASASNWLMTPGRERSRIKSRKYSTTP
jgi:hypothetical protein